MRRLNVKKVKEAVRRLSIKANVVLRPDIKKAVERALRVEKKARPRRILKEILDNANLARKDALPICQDTGIAMVLIEAGQDVLFTGGYINKAINEGVRAAYKEGFFRKSVVLAPITRKNTMTNTPAIITNEIISGDKIKKLEDKSDIAAPVRGQLFFV